MQKTFICVITIFVLSLPSFAITPMANLSIIENSLFGYENSKQPQSQRLETIETRIYGNIQKNSLEARLKKINADLGINLDDYKAIATPDSSLNEDKSTQYPIIDKIENKLYKKTYQGENVYKRLDRLDTKIFGAPNKASLNTRVEKLAQTTKIENPTDYNNIIDKPEYEYFSEESNIEPQISQGSQEIPTIQQPIPQGFNYTLNSLETKVLGKTYPMEQNEARIARLEKKLLHKSFSGESENSRLERLTAVSEAQKTSSGYDNNKWSKAINTGVQIGGILLMILTMLI